jgi:hypothetical protein
MWTCDLLLLQFQVLEQLLADGLLLQLHPLLPQTRVPNLGVQDAGLGVIELEEGPLEGAGELFLRPQHHLPEVAVPLALLLQVLLRVVLLLGFSTNPNPNYGREVLRGGEGFGRLQRGGRRRGPWTEHEGAGGGGGVGESGDEGIGRIALRWEEVGGACVAHSGGGS